MSEWTQDDMIQALEAVREKAATDKEFRKLCLENPGEAISQVAGKKLPDGINIKLVENEPGVGRTFVLPDREDEESESVWK